MQRFIRSVVVLAAVALSGHTAPAADPGPHTKESLQKIYLGAFTELGYKPELDADGDVKVRIEGKTYYVFVRPNSPTWFSMSGALATLGKGEDPHPVLLAASAANEKVLVANVLLINDSVYVTAKFRVAKPEDARAVLPKVIERLIEGRTAYENARTAQKAAGK